MDEKTFETLEEAIDWLFGLPEEYAVYITRTFRLGEDGTTGRNYLGEKSRRYGDIRISVDKPLKDGDGAGIGVSSADGDTLLEAIRNLRADYDTNNKWVDHAR